MKIFRTARMLVCLLLCFVAGAQRSGAQEASRQSSPPQQQLPSAVQQPSTPPPGDEPARTYRIEPAEISADRLIKDIGVQKSVLDSFALRDNVTNSLADVLSQNSSIFIKSYGRATLATASFRGTAPSHTQVLWNGMKLNSPMLGMVDFSMIPSYFIDDANLYHGASSVPMTGGGLGGAVALATRPSQEEGLGLRFVQGVGSFSTFDEFLRLTYGTRRWQSSTRLYYASSENDFKYTNYWKKGYPVERNRNGSYKDLHILQEFYFNQGNGNRWGASAWYINSRRGVPMLNVDYKDGSKSRNRQDEQTFRGVVSWDRIAGDMKLGARGGYTYTDLRYLYLSDIGMEELMEMIRSQSYVHTAFAKLDGEYYVGGKWLFMANLEMNQHFVRSSDRAVTNPQGDRSVIGYDQARMELSGFLSAKYRPGDRLGFAVNLREDMYGSQFTPLIPAVFVDYLLSKRGNVIVKASVARNFRYPTLNDLYFMPGGNDSLRSERGFTYDGGVEFTLAGERVTLKGEASAFDSRIDDWIVWLPTFKGFWTPKNVKRVRSYGLELKGDMTADMGRGWQLALSGNYTITNSINKGDRSSWGDEAIGKQLVYIPKYSSAVTGKLQWKSWKFIWRWSHYSERYTTSSNETATRLGVLAPYYMSDVSLARGFRLSWGDLSLKATVNNLFGEEYESVLSRPMAGRNFGFFIEVAPKLRKSKALGF